MSDNEVPEEEAIPSLVAVSDEERRKRQEIKEKRSVAGMEKRWQQADREELDKAVEANAPPVISEAKCHTCQNPHRLWIESMLFKGMSYKAIADSIPDGPDRRSISHHYQHHMRVDQAVVRGILEEEAGILNQNVEEGVKGAFTNRGALNVLIRKAYDDAYAGITTVEPRDLIQMIKLYNEMDSSASVQAMEEAKAAVRIYTDAIKNVFAEMLDSEMAQELQRSIVQEIQRLRKIDEIDAQVENELRVIPRVAGSNKRTDR